MEKLAEILSRLNIASIAENIDLNEFKIETVAEMSVYQLQKNLKMDKENAKKLHREFEGYRACRPKRPKIVKKLDTEFVKKFSNLSKIHYKPGDEWQMDICGAAFSASSKAFHKIFKMPGSSTQFGDANTFQNFKGWTPLQFATAMGRENVIELMLNEKVTNYLTQNHDGQTAMMIAASFGHSEIIKLLYNGFKKHCQLYPASQPADILNQQDKRGWSSLHYAAAHAQLDAVQILLSFGTNPNLPDFTRSTPTLLACEDELQETCLKLLLEAGGDLEKRNLQGKNGLEIASRDSVFKMHQRYSKKSSTIHLMHQSSPSLYGSF
uniref:Uncharacterized protein n=1 Tax=Panagrolaimus superbus TaxID=310955 RepID=A0A914Y7I0_9BILA